MKLLKILTLAFFLLASTFANASLMLTDDDYITVDHNGIDLDWVWASNYNVQYIYNGSVLVNELFAPTTIGLWREAATEEFSFFTQHVTAQDFERDTGGYKSAIRFFNSNDTLAISATDFDNGQISGEFREGTEHDFSKFFGGSQHSWYDTFYVRTSSLVTDAKPIPEPLTILIFATAFILLQMKLRKNSV